MTEQEKRLVLVVAKMVAQHLPAYEDEVDTLAESAGEHAIAALADYGMMTLVNSRFGRWTAAGKKLLEDDLPAGVSTPAPSKGLSGRGTRKR